MKMDTHIRNPADTIFVQIASYRDSELNSTLRDCFENADRPDLLSVGVCWQKDETERIDNNFLWKYKLKTLKFDYKESKGACWARHKAQTLYDNEKFQLQIDSHTRFVKGWDTILLEMFYGIGNEKAIITTYPPGYHPDKPREEWDCVAQIINVYDFVEASIKVKPMVMKDWKALDRPVKGRYCAGGFMFSSGSIINDVPYDPEFYFHGEELAFTIRAYTHGYEIYHPNKIILYHFYTRKDSTRHWNDHPNWGELNSKANSKLNELTLGKIEGKYGIGKLRTINEFEMYTGIDLTRRIVHSDVELGIEPQLPAMYSEDGWFLEDCQFDNYLKWEFDKIEKSEGDLMWAFFVLDQHDNSLCRIDIKNTNLDIFNGIETSMRFKFKHNLKRRIPKKLMIWPYNKNGWGKSSKFDIEIIHVENLNANKFLNFVGGIFVINLQDHIDRMDTVNKQFDLLGIKSNVNRFNAYHKQENTTRSAEIACSKSHLDVIRIAKNLKLKNVLIFEDDVVFDENFYESLLPEIDTINSIQNWSILYLGYNPISNKAKRISKGLIKIDKCFTTHAYIVNSNIYDVILDHKPGEFQIDVFLSNVECKKLAMYPPIAHQSAGYSSIQGVYVDYKNMIDNNVKNIFLIN